MIEISKNFIPTTDEVWRLQGVKANDASLFQEMADKGHYRRVGGSRQGIYVCSANGSLLSSVNSLDPDVVLETIKTGLSKWEELPKSDRQLPDNFSLRASHRWEDSYPEDGLVLKGAKADLLTDPPKLSERGDRWNMDHVWFSKDEMNLWLPDKYDIGTTHECPQVIKDRLFRFHLVDNVRGQTLPFAAEEIKDAELSIEVTENNSSFVTLKITGSSKAVAKGQWLLGENDWTPDHELDHSIETNMIGNAIYNTVAKNFIEFEMVALAEWSGKTQNNGRRFGPDTGKIGMVYNLAEKRSNNKIAPAFVDLYNAEWIQHP